LVDEINRATPKTQAALLEAMYGERADGIGWLVLLFAVPAVCLVAAFAHDAIFDYTFRRRHASTPHPRLLWFITCAIGFACWWAFVIVVLMTTDFGFPPPYLAAIVMLCVLLFGVRLMSTSDSSRDSR
jgi:hypothetical protein